MIKAASTTEPLVRNGAQGEHTERQTEKMITFTLITIDWMLYTTLSDYFDICKPQVVIRIIELWSITTLKKIE